MKFNAYKLVPSPAGILYNVVSNLEPKYEWRNIPDLMVTSPVAVGRKGHLCSKEIFDRTGPYLANLVDEELVWAKAFLVQVQEKGRVTDIDAYDEAVHVHFKLDHQNYSMVLAPLPLYGSLLEASADESSHSVGAGYVGHGMDGAPASVPL